MIPREPSAGLGVLYQEHVAPVRSGRPAMSLESHLHAVRHARGWRLGRRLLAETLVAPEYIAALEEELGVELEP